VNLSHNFQLRAPEHQRIQAPYFRT